MNEFTSWLFTYMLTYPDDPQVIELRESLKELRDTATALTRRLTCNCHDSDET